MNPRTFQMAAQSYHQPAPALHNAAAAPSMALRAGLYRHGGNPTVGRPAVRSKADMDHTQMQAFDCSGPESGDKAVFHMKCGSGLPVEVGKAGYNLGAEVTKARQHFETDNNTGRMAKVDTHSNAMWDVQNLSGDATHGVAPGVEVPHFPGAELPGYHKGRMDSRHPTNPMGTNMSDPAGGLAGVGHPDMWLASPVGELGML